MNFPHSTYLSRMYRALPVTCTWRSQILFRKHNGVKKKATRIKKWDRDEGDYKLCRCICMWITRKKNKQTSMWMIRKAGRSTYCKLQINKITYFSKPKKIFREKTRSVTHMRIHPKQGKDQNIWAQTWKNISKIMY